MKKIGFIMRDVWQQILYERFMSVIVALSLMVGMLFVFMGVNEINDLEADKKLSVYRDVEQLSIIDLNQEYEAADVIDQRIEEGIEKGIIADAAYYAISRQIVYVGSRSYSVYINACQPKYLEMDGNKLIAGRSLTQEDIQNQEKVCLLSYGGLDEEGAWIGDTVTILGADYKIVGVIQAPKMHGSVIVPYTTAQPLLSIGRNQYHIMVYGNPERKMQPGKLGQMIFPNGSLLSTETGRDMEKMYVDSVNQMEERMGMRCIFILLFMAISMCMIFAGKTMGDRYRVGVRLAIGAGKHIIAGEVILQNLILTLTALLADTVLYTKIAAHIKGLSPYLRVRTVLEVSFCSGVFIVILSTGIVRSCMHGKRIRIMLGRHI